MIQGTFRVSDTFTADVVASAAAVRPGSTLGRGDDGRRGGKEENDDVVDTRSCPQGPVDNIEPYTHVYPLFKTT